MEEVRSQAGRSCLGEKRLPLAGGGGEAEGGGRGPGRGGEEALQTEKRRGILPERKECVGFRGSGSLVQLVT